MKLSEAIRKGCEMVPMQARGSMCVPKMPLLNAYEGAGQAAFNGNSGVASACALGAAGIAVVGLPKAGEKYNHYLGSILRASMNLCDQANIEQTEVIALNDRGERTREQIADWLEEQGK